VRDLQQCEIALFLVLRQILEKANSLFLATMVDTNSNITTFWQTLFISLYWTCLYDLGHITSTEYWPSTSSSTTRLDVNATTYSTTNNIFINASLFGEYYSFLNSSVASGPSIPPLLSSLSAMKTKLKPSMQRLYRVIAV